MSGLKKLIIKNWFIHFFAAATVLLLLVSIANLIAGFLRGNVTAIEVVKNHLIELPNIINQIFPISSLVASLFSINKLKNRSELTAIFASGFSRKDFIMALIFASSIVASIQFVTAAYVSPFTKRFRNVILEDGDEKFRNLKSKGLRSSTIGTGKVWYKSGNYYFSFAAFDKEKSTLKDIDLYIYDENYHLEKHVNATHAVYQSKKDWMLYNATVINALGQVSYPSKLTLDHFAYSLNESSSDFDKIEADTTTLNIQSLFQYINRLDRSGINTNQYRVLLYNMFSAALICIVFAVLASVSIFNPNRRGSSFGKSIAYVLVFTLVYWLIASYVADLGKYSKVPPEVASFFVPLIFIVYLSAYFYRYRKLR